MKQQLRKCMAWVLTLCMALAFLPTHIRADDTTYADMPDEDYWSYAALQSAVSHGILSGDENGRLNPKGLATRAQVATIINRVFGASEQADISAYTDVKADNWYYADMAKAVQMRTFVGTGTALSPNADITREQVFTVIARALKLESANHSALMKFSDGGSVSAWAQDSISALVAGGYVNGSDGKLSPQSNITREEIAQIIYNIFQQYIDAAGTYTTVQQGNVIVNVPDVTLKDASIAGDLIIGDGVGNGDITLDNVSVSGRVIVRGGGEHSIRITNGSNIGNIVLSKTSSGGVRVLASNGARVDIVQVNDGQDAVLLEGAFGEVQVTTDTPLKLADANVAQLTVASENADVSIESGTVASVTVTEAASSATLSTGEGSSVGTIEVASAATVKIAGSVAQITVAETASGDSAPTLNLSDTAKVNTLTVSEGADVTVQTESASAIGTIKAADTDSVKVESNSDAVKNQVEARVQETTSTNPNTSPSTGTNTGIEIYTPVEPVVTGTVVTTATQLSSALENDDVTSITISGSFTVSGDYVSVAKPITLQRGSTLTLSHATIDVWYEGSFTNYGTISGNSAAVFVRTQLNNYGTIGSDVKVVAAQNSTVSGVSGTVYSWGGPDYYLADGTFESGDVSGTITADSATKLLAAYGFASGGDLIVYEGAKAIAQGNKGVQNFAGSDKSYVSLTIEKAESAEDNEITLSNAVNIDGSVVVSEGVTLTIDENAMLKAQTVSLQGAGLTVNGTLQTVAFYQSGETVENNGMLTCSSMDIYKRQTMEQDSSGNWVNGQSSPATFVNNGSVTVRETADSYTGIWISGEGTSLTQNKDAYFAASCGVYVENGATLTVNSPVGSSGTSSKCFVLANGGRIYLDREYFSDGNTRFSTLNGSSAEALESYTVRQTYAEGFAGLKAAIDAGETSIYAGVPSSESGPFTLSEDITINGYLSVSSALVIPSGVTLTVDNGGELHTRMLTIQSGGELVVNGDEASHGRVYLSGLQNDGTITNNGYISVNGPHEAGEAALPCVVGTVTGNPIVTSSSAYTYVRTPEEFWAAQARSDVDEVNYYVDGGELTVSGTQKITKRTYIGKAVKLTVPEGATLTVSGQLTVNGDADIAGTLTTSGVITELMGDSTLSGTLNLTDQGRLRIGGESTFDKTLKISIPSDCHIGVYVGGTVHQLCDLVVSNLGLLYTYGLYEVHGKLTNNGSVEVNSDARSQQNGEMQIMNGGSMVNNGWLRNDKGTVTVQANGTLTNSLQGTISTPANVEVNDGGSFTEAASTYAVVSGLRWVGDSATEHAEATLNYFDGTTAAVVTVSKLNGNTPVLNESADVGYLQGAVSAEKGRNPAFLAKVQVNEGAAEIVPMTIGIGRATIDLTEKTITGNEGNTPVSYDDNTKFIVLVADPQRGTATFEVKAPADFPAMASGTVFASYAVSNDKATYVFIQGYSAYNFALTRIYFTTLIAGASGATVKVGASQGFDPTEGAKVENWSVTGMALSGVSVDGDTATLTLTGTVPESITIKALPKALGAESGETNEMSVFAQPQPTDDSTGNDA